MKDARWIRTAIVALAGAALTLALSASAEAAPPPNDNYGSATQFEPTPGTVLGTNVDATRQSGEPQNGDSTVWWKWTATETGRFRLDTCQTVPSFDSVIGVYVGPNAANLTEIAKNDDGGCGSTNLSTLSFDAIAGVEYRFSVGTFGSESLNIRLSLRRTPLNDNYAAAYDFGAAQGSVRGSNFEATRELGEPRNGDATIWWKWVAPTSGSYHLDTCDTVPAADTYLGVYTGASVAQLLETATADDGSCGGGSALTELDFNAVQGTEYRFSVGTFGSESQNIVLGLISQACIDAKKAVRKAKDKVAKAQAKYDKAKKKVKKAKSKNKKRKAKAAKKKAKKKLKNANSALESALATSTASC